MQCCIGVLVDEGRNLSIEVLPFIRVEVMIVMMAFIRLPFIPFRQRLEQIQKRLMMLLLHLLLIVSSFRCLDERSIDGQKERRASITKAIQDTLRP
jgi:hypothetical protein